MKIRIKDIIRENSKSLDTEFVSDMTLLPDCKMFLARFFQLLILIRKTKSSKIEKMHKVFYLIYVRIHNRSNLSTKSNSL